MVYLPSKLGDFIQVNVGKCPSTMVPIWAMETLGDRETSCHESSEIVPLMLAMSTTNTSPGAEPKKHG